ncbi:hypothetical protein QJQ45_009174 [Haematococcus lacustris]|nr:hypothetical protein QJQ45_009174 [Haematococcus lacustris]
MQLVLGTLQLLLVQSQLVLGTPQLLQVHGQLLLGAPAKAGDLQTGKGDELLDEFGLDQFDNTSTPVEELNAQIATLQAQLVAVQANTQQVGAMLGPCSYALTHSGYPTWPYLSQQFLEFVGEDLTTDADAARAKLLDSTHLRMTNGVALSAYITDFRNTLTLAGKDCMTDSMLVSVSQRGLSADLRGPVAKDLRALVAPTLDEAIKAAITNHKALMAAAGSGVHPASRRPVAVVHQVAQAQRGLQNLARYPGPPPGRPAAPSADSKGPPPASGYCYHCGLSSHWTKHCKRKASVLTKVAAMKDAGTWELMQDLKKGGSAPYKATKRDRSPDRGGDPSGPPRQFQGRHPQGARHQANPTLPPTAYQTANPPEDTTAQSQRNTLPSQMPQPTPSRTTITLTTFNVRGLHRSRKDVLHLVHTQSPDILILTETMTQPKSNNPSCGWLKRVMPNYIVHRHRGHSEVLIGIKHDLAIQTHATMLPPCTDAQVNTRCVILTLRQHKCEELTIVATYWPSGDNDDAIPLREKMQEHIRTTTERAPGSLILAGDINATMRKEDRYGHTEYTQDRMMRKFADKLLLFEADPGDRAWTYQQPHCNSRIDAILTRDARHGSEHRTHVDTHAYLSDHRPLTATLTTARLGINLAAIRTPQQQCHTVLTTPITNNDREAYRLAVQQPSSGAPQLHARLTAYLAPMYTEATHFLATLDKANPHQPQRLAQVAGLTAREAVDTASTMLTTLLETCRRTAMQTCNTKTLTRGGQHYQRRTMCRIRLALGEKLKTTRNLCRQARLLFKQNGSHPTIGDLIPETDTTNAEVREAIQARQGDDPTEDHVPAALAKLTNSYRDQIHQLDDDDSALAIAQARVRMQQLISNQPKKANKYILRPSRTEHKGLQALSDPITSRICTAPADLNRIITDAYGKKLAPPTPKTGHYTNTRTRNYPWARAKADDPFSMHTCKNIHWLHTAIMDKAGFQECLSRLAGGKAPGPDGIENEIIKMLPWEMRDTIHQLFIVMWATGCTPTTWKTSDTCLLYKDKGQETDLKAYRPVGLANTIYKLWTTLITKTLYEYAEAKGMLSNCQAGFRSHRDTTQQLQMLVMALEDAKLAKTDIYALLVDFTSAFNTTCQDKLLWIMHDLGFPTDATDAVKDLYTGATTRFKTPYGHTDPVPVDRGTIQGDSLSPFLFLIYIEPLLRWLQVGARGYKFTSETTDSAGRFTIGSIDYADDIAILCNSISNLRCQADKLSAYSDWGHLIISHSKTLATAALHKAHQSGRCSTLADAEKQARRELQHVQLQRKPVTYLPPTAPFAYLGVLLTMTLNWKPQHMAMAAQLKQKLERLRRSFAIARQAIHIIKTAIIPSLAYSFCVVPCTPGDLDLYDRAVNQCVKKKLRLPLGTTNAVIREDIDKLGLGISSTAQEYHARNTTALIHSLQSADDTHAHITRSMLHKQITWLYAQAAKHGHRMINMLQHTLRARQLLHATTAQLKATHQGEELYPKETKLLGQLITQDNSPLPHDIVNASITCLKSLGIKHAYELQQAIAEDTYIISGKMLKDRFGNKVKQKHYIALNKLAAMASRDECPTAIEAKAIADTRDTTLNLPAAQRKIKHWAAGLTELAPIVAEEDSKHRYADIRSYAVAKQPPTQPPAQEPTAECAHQPDDTRRRSSRLRNKALNPPPATPQPKPPPKIGNSLPSWKANAACERNAKELGITLGAMYDHQESITKIDGWHWNGINKESYYNVHWGPTIIEKWALQMCKEEGYTPMHTEDISRADAKHVCTCELCWEPIGDSPMCNNCMRAYHPACLAQTGLAGTTTNNHWLCPVCAHGSDDLKGAMKQSAATDLLKVHWHPTTEPNALIQAHLDYTAKQKEYDAENNRRQGTGRPPPDAGLPGHTRQGLPDPHTWLPRCIDLHSKATFQVSPVNPQTDIVGTGRCETTIQQHAHIITPATSEGSQGPTLPQYSLPTHVIAHDEAGRTVGLLTNSKQQDLATWLQHTPHPRDHATELVALLRRHDTQNTPQPIQAAQDQAISTLYTTNHFPSTVQRCANPLTVRAETTTYWSPDINDTAYGAHHNCLLVRHTGLSTWNVPAEDAIALNCIRHAIHSATQEEAMATILLIPGKKGISYPKHIDMLRSYPEYCQHIATIPLNKPNAAAKSDKHAKLITYIVWNRAGQQLVTHGNPQGWLANAATALHPRLRTHPALAKPSQHNQPTPLPSGHHKHRGLPADHELPSTGHTRQTNQPASQPTTHTHRAIPEWKKVTYTDGSCIKGTEGASVGAGVYTPASDDRNTIALTGDTTINRAELIAILSALQVGAKRIATDSLCSLYQIRRALANPMSLRTHRHKDILAEIATILTNSQDTVHFFKVRAHSGIIGNEGADALAKHAARHPEQATTRGPSPPRHIEQHAWLSTTSDLNVTTPLPDCRHSVRAHMSNKHKLGLANQESIYYQMSQEITKVAAKGSCERVMTDAGIPTEAQRTALLYRTGGLYNQKLAMRWGKAADDRCPLCGEADSATHLLSGCSRTAGLVQERHNGAGRLIMKAISKGAQGGCIKFADIGSHERGETEGIDLPSATLRKALEDLSLSARDTNMTTRPDIIMINNTKKRKQGSNELTKHVTLLEIKYCADSRWAEQLDNATTQHAAMAEAIIAAGHTVTIRPILLGIGGITYNAHTKIHMEAIGITQTNTTKLLNKLTRHARVMNDAFAPVLNQCALVYLDDILVMSKSVDEHLKHLRKAREDVLVAVQARLTALEASQAAVNAGISAIRAVVTPVSAYRPGRTGGAGGAGTSRSHGAAAPPPAPVIWCYHCGVTGHKTPNCPDGHLTQEEAMRKNGNTGMFLALQSANEKLRSASGNKRPRPPPPGDNGGSAPGPNQNRNGPGGRGGRSGKGGAGRNGGRGAGQR